MAAFSLQMLSVGESHPRSHVCYELIQDTTTLLPRSAGKVCRRECGFSPRALRLRSHKVLLWLDLCRLKPT